VNDGQELWNKLVSRHPNFRMTLNGHVLRDGTARLRSEGANGRTVYQMLANYQMRERGGNGYLRLYEFLPDGETVRVKTYSPVLDRYRTNPADQFKFKLGSEMSGR